MQHMDDNEVAQRLVPPIESRLAASGISMRMKVEVLFSLAAILIAAAVFAFVTPSKVTNASRISHLESLVKCPTCISVSTADANTASAIALRSFISTMVNSGASDQEVIAQLETTYGKSVLLVPPNGLGALLTAGTAALALVVPFGFVFVRVRRRRRQESEADLSIDADLYESVDSKGEFDEALQVADIESSQLMEFQPTAKVASIADRGVVRPRFSVANLTLVQRVIGVFGLVFLLSGISILGLSLLSSSNGKVSSQLTPTQISTLISNGQTLASFGQDKSALSAFSKVLTVNPNQPVALAWNGWLLTKSGVSTKSSSLVSAGVAQLQQSISVDPTYLYSRLFYGLVLANDQNDPAAAVLQFEKFFSLNPPQNLVVTIKSQMVTIYSDAKVPLPSQLG